MVFMFGIFIIVIYLIRSYDVVAQECLNYHKIEEKETCFSLAADNGISLLDLLLSNPEINCNNLQKGHQICIESTRTP